MAKYTIIPGSFPCHVCKVIVKTLRSYGEIKELTWMCPERHLSKVDLSPKKKKHYE